MRINPEKSAWQPVALGDVAAASKEKVDSEDGSVERYIAGEHMDTNNLQLCRWGSIGDTDLGPAFHRRFRPGQVLYGSRRTYLRKVSVADFDGVCANTTFVVQTKDDETLLQRFLPLVMSSEPFHSFAIAESKGSVNPYVNWSDIERFEFFLPSRDEQKRIANLLWSLEHYAVAVKHELDSLNALLHKLRAETIEACPSIVKASEAFEITIGRQRSPKHASGKNLVPYMRSANVAKRGINLKDVKEMNFNPNEQEKFALRLGDVLVSEGSASATAVGMPAVWNGEINGVICFQNTLLRYRAMPNVTLAGYVEQWCRWAFETGAFLRTASGTNIHHIGAGGAAGMDVALPTLKEQEGFLNQASVLLHAVQETETELSRLEELRSSILAEVFGGN